MQKICIAVLLIALCCLLSCHKTEGSTDSLIGFVGIGYDLLKGNPEGDFNIGGVDKGYRAAHNILKRTYAEGKETTFQGEVVNLPDQMQYQPLSSCSSVASTSVFSGTESYQKKLDINTEVSGESVQTCNQ